MSPKSTKNSGLGKLGMPTWAEPGIIRLGKGKKIPTEAEKGYTTKCAIRYAKKDTSHLTAVAKHTKSGGNVGWVPPEGILVIDCDNHEAVHFVESRIGKGTPVQKRREDKQHFYFSYDPKTFNAYCRNGIALDVGKEEEAKLDLKTCGFIDPEKAGGGYVVIPPSTHEDQEHPAYKRKRKLPAKLESIPEIPLDIRNALLPFLTKGKVKTSDTNRHIKVLKYQQRLVIEAEIDDADTMDRIITATRGVAEELYEGDVSRLKETLDQLDRAYVGAKKHPNAFQGYSEDGSDEYLAVVIAHYLDTGIRYVSASKDWLVWDDECWIQASTEKIKKVIGDYHRELLTEAAYEQNDVRQERLSKSAMKLKGVHAVNRVYERMRNNLNATLDEFDIHRNLVTFPGCQRREIEAVTMDLETGLTEKTKSAHMITRVMGSPYVENAKHPMVDRFWEESFPDEETRHCVKMHLGVTLLGHMPVERFYFLHGKGASGKGTLAAAVLSTLGGYATVADPSTFSGHGSVDGSRNAPDLFALRGTRFVFVDEIAATRTLGSKLKNLTQDGTVTAAGKYMAQVTFPITWTTWIAGNARPNIDSTDKGLMRRIVEVPMDAGATDNDHIDWRVKDTLANDPEAIAAFMWTLLEGLAAAREYDFRPPISSAMQAATDEWIELSDKLGPWLAERVEITHNDGCKEMSSSLFTDYEEWMDETYGYRSRRDVPRANPSQFAAGLKARGLEKRRTKRGWMWLGLQLRQVLGVDKGVFGKGGTPLSEADKLPN